MGEKFLSLASLLLGMAAIVLMVIPSSLPAWIPTGLGVWAALSAFMASPTHSLWVSVARWGLFLGTLGALLGFVQYGTIFFASIWS